jgi:deoxyribonucleoside regulator
MTLEGLRQVRRSIAICGGKEKFPAILGAVRGQWINTLVTDQHTAQRLAKAQTGKGTAA